MTTNVSVTEVTEQVNVADTTTNISVAIVDEVISIQAGGDIVQVTTQLDTVVVTEQQDTVLITEQPVIIQPNVGEVIIQIVEDSSMPVANRVDFIAGTDNLYRGQAPVGTLNSAPSWRISFITINSEGDVTETWADGDASFDNIWDDRTTKVYS